MRIVSVALLALSIAVTGISFSLISSLTNTETAIVLTVRDGQEVAIALPASVTDRQRRLLNFAYEVAKEDGYKKPQWLQGIILQETKAGNLPGGWRVSGLENKVGDRYFGIGQLKLAAAKDVMAKHPDMWRHLNAKTDEELQARLILDDEFNIRVASKYGLMMGINKDAARGITAYNRGEGGARAVDSSTWHYTVAVKDHVARLK